MMTENGNGDAARLLKRMQSDLPIGRVPARIFNSASIWELERSRVFGHCWLFLGHESEVPEPGDYVVRPMADTSVILCRDDAGRLRAHLNMCRHRGNQICRAAEGNAARFKCSYHGWTYASDGRLVGVPYLKEAYNQRLDKDAWGLVSVRVASYQGLVFATLDPQAPSLEDYLGGFEFYLDLYLKPGRGGTEVIAPPDRWVAPTDWKICAENFAGDGYHTPVTHQFGFKLGYFPSSAKTHVDGWAVHVPGRGHAIGLGHTPGMPPFFGYPDAIVESMQDALSDAQLEVFSQVRTAVGTVFPNFSLLIQPFSPIPGDPGLRFCTIRLWHPTGAGSIEMWSWCLVPADATAEYKSECYKAYTLAFGQAGMFEQDDFENWSSVTRMAGSSVADDLSFPYEMGLDAEPELDFPGPGVAVRPYVTEVGFRNLWARWLELMSTPPARPTTDEVRSEQPVDVLR